MFKNDIRRGMIEAKDLRLMIIEAAEHEKWARAVGWVDRSIQLRLTAHTGDRK